MHIVCAAIYRGERMLVSFCVESIHEHPEIKNNYASFKFLVNYTEIFVIQLLELAPALSSLMILSGWFAASMNMFGEKKDLTQIKIDQVYINAIHAHYKIVKADDSVWSPLRTMHKSNLAEMIAQYGHYLYRNQRYQEANKYYTQAIANNPNHLTAYNQQGMCFANMDDYENARCSFFEILNKTTNKQTQADAHLNISWTLRLEVERQPELEKKTEQALDHIAKAKKFSPFDAEILAEENKISALRLSKALPLGRKGFFITTSHNNMEEEITRVTNRSNKIM